jgi:hypothetical protein
MTVMVAATSILMETTLVTLLLRSLAALCL